MPKLKTLRSRENLWTQAYYVGAARAVSVEVIRRYIAACQGK
ncbi:transposase [Methylacidiphilum fumariolicum]|nr:transposase [Candidatus Methylacidiphilum fumarolicum]